MKKLLLLTLTIAMLFVLFGCSEKDKSPTKVYGYKLDQFISKTAVFDSTTHSTSMADSVEIRNLYAYEIVSADSDHWSPRTATSTAGYDLSWNQFKNGFYMPSDANLISWFPNTTLPGAFKVKRVGFFRLYRKIDVTASDGSTKMVELKSLPLFPIDNWNHVQENAIKLSDLVQGIAAYDSLKMVGVDGFSRTYSSAQIADGYYLLDSEVTTFPLLNGTTLTPGIWKVKNLAYIDVIGVSSPQSFTFINALEETADMIFLMPSSMNSYTTTDVTGLSK